MAIRVGKVEASWNCSVVYMAEYLALIGKMGSFVRQVFQQIGRGVFVTGPSGRPSRSCSPGAPSGTIA